MDFFPFVLSIKISIISTIIVFVLGIGAGALVIRMKRFQWLLDALFTLPLVLPPTVLGFFLLVLFGKNGILGKTLNQVGINLVFSWKGAVIAAAVVAFPLMYRTAKGAFMQVPENLIYVARTLGKNEFWIFRHVLIPNSIHSIIAGTVLAFARGMGEFGATMMIAGNIPGKTQTMALAVYNAVQSGDRSLAYRWTMIICIISLISIILLGLVEKGGAKGSGRLGVSDRRGRTKGSSGLGGSKRKAGISKPDKDRLGSGRTDTEKKAEKGGLEDARS